MTTSQDFSLLLQPEESTKTTRPKLKMIWVKEFDSKRDRLVAKWVKDSAGK